MTPEKAVTNMERMKRAPAAGNRPRARSFDFNRFLLFSTRKTTPMAYSREEKMTLAVQTMERIPTHPNTPARWEIAPTSLKMPALA
jgi:hypothetical protein